MLYKKFSRIMVTIVSCAFIINMSVADTLRKGEEQKILRGERLADELAKSLSHISDFKISRQYSKKSNKYSFLNTELDEIQTYKFKSEKPISESSEGKTYLRFTLSILTYKDSSSAKIALDALLASSDPDMGLSYAWDYVANEGTRVFWISAPCLLSNQNWQKLKTKLKEKILAEASGKHGSFGCKCGRGCARD